MQLQKEIGREEYTYEEGDRFANGDICVFYDGMITLTKHRSEYYNLYLPAPNFKQGELFCCHELTEYFKEVLLRRYINGV